MQSNVPVLVTLLCLSSEDFSVVAALRAAGLALADELLFRLGPRCSDVRVIESNMRTFHRSA